MKPHHFLGVPHAQLNAYLQMLVLYSLRTKRGHPVSLPALPEFSLRAVAMSETLSLLSDAEGKEAEGVEVLIEKELERCGSVAGYGKGRALAPEKVKETRSDPECEKSRDTTEKCPSLISTASVSSHQGSRSDCALESNAPLLRITSYDQSSPQIATLMARQYQDIILTPRLGPTIPFALSKPGTEPDNPKTYGWRLVFSDQVINPFSIADFEASLKADMENGKIESGKVRVLYFAIPSGAETVQDVTRHMFDSSTQDGGPQFSSNAHKALALSPWICPLSHEPTQNPLIRTRVPLSQHDPQTCSCSVKCRKVLVAAALKGSFEVLHPGEGEKVVVKDEKRILPLRLETWVWSPRRRREVRAYAEFVGQEVVKEAEGNGALG